jgi:hypothetical protein
MEEYIDSYRPATLSFEGGERRPSTRAASLPPELAELARELEIDTEDISPTRYARAATQTDRSGTVQQIYDLIAEAGADESSPASAHEMRRQLRAIGIDIGNSADDDEDRRSTARHEGAHATIAHALGFTVNSVDIEAGETNFDLPLYFSSSLSERNKEFGMIGAAGAAASGWGSDREEFRNDRISLRAKGLDFEEARKSAEKLLADPDVKATLERLTRALIMVGRLEGDALLGVLDGEL